MTNAPLSTAPPEVHALNGRHVLEVEGLNVSFSLPDGRYPVITDVSLQIARGERVALVGESGSGKSVTALALMRLLPPLAKIEASRLRVAERDILDLSEEGLRGIRGRHVAMVFQDPMSSLNPLLRVEDQIVPPMRRHLHLPRDQARRRAVELLVSVGIPEPDRCLRAFPHELSGGMRQRVMIAIALSCGPQLLIADEPTTALDVTIQAQIIELLRSLSEEMGIGCLLVTHDLGVVARFAQHVNVMYGGRIVEHGPVQQIFRAPRHPYTQALLASVPSPRQEGRLRQIDGTPPDLQRRPPGCPFAPRCPQAAEECRTTMPDKRAVGMAHEAACHAIDRRIAAWEERDA